MLQATTRYRADPFGSVINLSNKVFSIHEFKLLLGYNLNFIPAPGHLNLNHFNQDIIQFGRKIKLRAHFGPSNQTNNTEIMFHKGNKTWEPSQVHHTISTFLENFSNSLNETLKRQKDKKAHNRPFRK